jgi:hypothetical protein
MKCGAIIEVIWVVSMEYYTQTSLDEYYSLDEYVEEETVNVEEETIKESEI